jgi:hypothetical protein
MEQPYIWALHYLNRVRYRQKPLMDPFNLLSLAFQCDIVPWVEPALRGILDSGTDVSKIMDLKQDELVTSMGYPVYMLIIKSLLKVESIYQQTAKSPPSIPTAPLDSPPHDHQACRTRWHRFWTSVICPVLLDKARPIKLVDIGDFIKSQVIGGMPKECVDFAVDKVVESPVRYHENDAIEKLVGELTKLISPHHFSGIDKDNIRY